MLDFEFSLRKRLRIATIWGHAHGRRSECRAHFDDSSIGQFGLLRLGHADRRPHVRQRQRDDLFDIESDIVDYRLLLQREWVTRPPSTIGSATTNYTWGDIDWSSRRSCPTARGTTSTFLAAMCPPSRWLRRGRARLLICCFPIRTARSAGSFS